MKVCYFGIYDSEYSRNKILISGLRQNGVTVLECQSKLKGFYKYIDLFKKHKKIRNDYDVMIVGFPGFQSVILAKLITSKPIIFDAFVSLYDSMILDRGESKPNSFRSTYLWYLDKISMSLPKIVLFDTQEHINFVSKEFNITKSKFHRIFVGADTQIFYPREKNNTVTFKVVNYGHYVPLQGMENIVKAAEILKDNNDIFFEIIGDGKGKQKVLDYVKEKKLINIEFKNNLSLKELSNEMSSAGVCLGIFGKTDKAKRVIPNKVYEAVALKKPVITYDTPAIRELFTENELFLVDSSPESIAQAILKVKQNREEAESFAQRAFDKFTDKASIIKIGEDLKSVVVSII